MSAEWRHCAPVRECQNAETLGHASPERVGAPLQMCQSPLAWESLCAPVEARGLLRSWGADHIPTWKRDHGRTVTRTGPRRRGANPVDFGLWYSLSLPLTPPSTPIENSGQGLAQAKLTSSLPGPGCERKPTWQHKCQTNHVTEKQNEETCLL